MRIAVILSKNLTKLHLADLQWECRVFCHVCNFEKLFLLFFLIFCPIKQQFSGKISPKLNTTVNWCRAISLNATFHESPRSNFLSTCHCWESDYIAASAATTDKLTAAPADSNNFSLMHFHRISGGPQSTLLLVTRLTHGVSSVFAVMSAAVSGQ